MKIAIIGGGWVGCHLANSLKKEHDVTIFEKEPELFSETSYKNQNRLHYGYHYPRNYKTREMCKDTYEIFMGQYGHMIMDIPQNLYCVPNKKSIIDFNTYLQIYKDFGYENSDFLLKNIDGCVNTNEKFIDHRIAKNFFNEELKDNFIQKKITKKGIKKLSENFDLVINSTNNMLRLFDDDSFFELTISLIYEKVSETNFDSLTIMDGNFFSIYPYGDNLFTLTDVEYTPIKRFSKPEQIKKYKTKITPSFVNDVRVKMEKKVMGYYDDFHNDFKYKEFFLSIKCKPISGSDERYPVINKTDNIINCYTGKIQGVYIISDYINNLIND
jgi:hypothetical protein